ncbi:MAG: hypothetical protein IJQ85_01745 [Selenomonadaceae bacterium]|nr:hypothetical protein [Selenomonadaceae bacterium]
MNDFNFKSKIKQLREEQSERERTLENLHEEILREEHKLILLERNMEKIRRDIRELNQTIDYLRRKFLKP